MVGKQFFNAYSSGSNCSFIPHPPKGYNHAERKNKTGNDPSDTKEDHLILDIFDDTCLSGDMEVIDQRLQASFVNVITKIAESRAHDEKENDGTEDDGDLDPLLAGDKSNGEEKDVSGKRDKDGNE